MHYVIIGNSAAAVGCIEGIRENDKKGKITVVASEPHHTYSRPLISYLLCGKTDRKRMQYRPENFYKTRKCETVFGKTVTKIDSEKKQVILDDKTVIPYDKLLVAAGSKPFIPPMQGLETVKNCFTFMSLDDALALEKALSPDSQVLIVGAGLIGLKCAEGIADKVKGITVVDLAPRILPSILDEDGAKMVQKHIEKKNIRFILSNSVKEFAKNTATLQDGKQVKFDIAVIAVGVRPNTELVSQAGGKVEKGIVTNEYCETTIPDIYAAGDCAESYDEAFGASRVLALLPNAYMQGNTAGLNMTGRMKPYNKAIAMNAIGFFGLHIITAGCYDGQEYTVKTKDVYKKLITKDNCLKGYMMIGDVARAGIYTALIRERTPLDTIDFDLIKEKPQLMAFTSGERAVKLGTVPV